MPALCVAFLEELSDKEKLAFDQLGRQEERAEMVLKHPFLADKFARLDYDGPDGDGDGGDGDGDGGDGDGGDGDGDGGGETQLTIICQTSGGGGEGCAQVGGSQGGGQPEVPGGKLPGGHAVLCHCHDEI